MPIRQLKPYVPPPPAKEPSLLERIGGIPGVLAGGTRALTGAASAEGGVPGAIISGAGELGAEALEGSLWKQSPLRSLLRVGTAAGIGAVPFGAVLKEGQPIASAARGALYSGGGTAATELAAGENVDPEAVATSAAGGGLLTGLMAKLFGRRAPEVPTKKWEIEPTSRAERAPRPITSVAETTPIAVKPSERPRVSAEVPYSYEYAGGPAAKSAAKEAAAKTKEELRDQRNLAQVEKWLVRQRAATEKADKQAAAAAEIARIKEEQGLVPRAPRVSESFAAPTELGTERATIPYGKPKKGGEGELDELADILTPSSSARVTERPLGPPPPAPAAATPEVSPAIQQARAQYPEEVNAELDKLGEQYRSLPPGTDRRAVGKQMAEIRDFFTPGKMRESWKGASAEPAVSAAIPADVTPAVPSAPVKTPVTGQAQTEKARAAALAARKAKQAAAPVPAPGATPPKQAKKFETLFEKMKAEKLKSEKGAIDPALLAKLGMTAGGAAVGAAADPFDNRLESAVAGGAAGYGLASAPQILQSMGAHPATFENLSEKLNLEGVKTTAQKIFKTLPQIQRFNYLTSAVGLPANALAGPYGSAVMASLEHGLSGDARGWEALKKLTPKRFWDEFKPARAEAQRRIAEGEMGRTEGLGVGGGASPLEHVAAWPGVQMTAGDLAARNILREAGFTEEEARRITLTGEPELFLPKKIADFGKGKDDVTKDLANVLFPFRRTPANIWEQGMERLPGIGFMLQSYRANPDPLKQQVIQQLLSTGVAGVSGLAGANLDPETAKIVRRYMTNFAGQYSMPATMGFAAGQALQGGKPVFASALKAGAGDLPLPTVQPVSELFRFITDPSVKNLPSGSYPALFKELAQYAEAGGQPQLRSLPRLRRLR